MIKILAFAGSCRKDSYNKKVLNIAALGAKGAGADVTVIDLKDFDMPIYNQDIEELEFPKKALEFKQLLLENDGFLIASPEYNSAFSPLLKNVIDWASRPTSENETPLSAYSGKTAAIMSASPGPLGGLRGLVFLRMLLGNIGVTVHTDQQVLSNAFKMFDENGNLNDDRKNKALLNLGSNLVKMTENLKY